MGEIKLNDQQRKAAQMIVEWYNGQPDNGKQVFTIAGYAGTGKSTLVNHIIARLLGFNEDKVAYATPTGKAATVLMRKGAKQATTIHRLIYDPVVSESINVVNGKEISTKTVRFAKKRSIGDFKLIVLDEVSMVNDRIMADLLSYGIPILATGDPGQLPPVAASPQDLLLHPDVTLTEVVRQTSDNAILGIATKARMGEYIDQGIYNDGQVIVIDRSLVTNRMLEDYINGADQVICGRNATRARLNDYIRSIKGFSGDPKDGEKIVCEENNYEVNLGDGYALVNGMSGTVRSFRKADDEAGLATLEFRPDFLGEYSEALIAESAAFSNYSYRYDRGQTALVMADGSYHVTKPLRKKRMDESYLDWKAEFSKEFLLKRQSLGEFRVNKFQFGYAISCHKSQGSEWDSVLLFDESRAFGQQAPKWLYTGITRAAKKLVIIRSSK